MNWYEELFNQDYDRIYLRTFTAEKNRSEVDFIVSALTLSPGARVLDVACGHGRHAIELAKRGYTVVGIDLSPRFIEMAKKAASEKGLSNVDFLTCDMRRFHFATPFDAAFLYFTSFGYFSDEENKEVLKQVAQSLVKEGRLLIETVNRDWTIHRVENQPRRWDEIEPDFFLLEDIGFNAHTSRIHTKRIIFDHGTPRSVEYDIKLYTHTELEDMLEAVGFQVIATYGNKDSSPYAVSSPRMIIVAKRL
ncbi:MAG: class I SAM-dependent methyltransferase [Terriglobia bacterium]